MLARLVLLLLAAPALLADVWAPSHLRRVLSATPEGDGYRVVWSDVDERAANVQTIYTMRFDATGQPEPATLRIATPSTPASAYHAVQGSSGPAMLVWSGTEEHPGLRVSRIDGNGELATPAGREIAIGTVQDVIVSCSTTRCAAGWLDATERAGRLAVFDHDGRVTAGRLYSHSFRIDALALDDDTLAYATPLDRGFRVTRLAAGGTVLFSKDVDEQVNLSSERLAIANDNVTAIWVGAGGIRATRFAPDGTRTPSQDLLQVNAHTALAEWQIAADGSGYLFAVVHGPDFSLRGMPERRVTFLRFDAALRELDVKPPLEVFEARAYPRLFLVANGDRAAVIWHRHAGIAYDSIAHMSIVGPGFYTGPVAVDRPSVPRRRVTR